MTAINEGIYRIKSVATGQLLTYNSEGGDEYAKLRVWDRDGNDNSMTFRKQRWLLALQSGSRDNYNIINIHWGVLAGVYKGERENSDRGKAFVQGAACTTNSENVGWIFERYGDGPYYHINWQPKQWDSRCMDVAGGGRDNDVLAYPYNASNPTNQLWELEFDNSLNEKPYAAWMSHVPNGLKLTQISVPATHQSLAIRSRGPTFTANAHCQDTSIYEQLADGIRMFDLRLTRWQGSGEPPCLRAIHTIVTEGPCAAAVLQQIRVFLQYHPQEVVFINVVNESQNADGGLTGREVKTDADDFLNAWLQDFQPMMMVHPGLFWPSGSTRAYEVLLRQLQERGKVFIIRPDGDNRHLNVDWKHDGHNYFASEGYLLSSLAQSSGADGAWLTVTAAVNDAREDLWYSVNWANSSFPTAMNGDPWDWVQKYKPDMRNAYYPGIIGTNGSKHRVGIASFDFQNECRDVIGDIIRNNQSCGSLGR